MSDSSSGETVALVIGLIVGIVIGSCATQSYKRDALCRERLDHAATARDTIAVYRDDAHCINAVPLDSGGKR